jgi:hypothetical protein
MIRLRSVGVQHSALSIQPGSIKGDVKRKHSSLR